MYVRVGLASIEHVKKGKDDEKCSRACKCTTNDDVAICEPDTKELEGYRKAYSRKIVLD